MNAMSASRPSKAWSGAIHAASSVQNVPRRSQSRASNAIAYVTTRSRIACTATSLSNASMARAYGPDALPAAASNSAVTSSALTGSSSDSDSSSSTSG